jgi:hypothetical protein
MLSPIKVIIASSVGALLWTGCTGPAAKVAESLSHDGATVQVKLQTIYGSMSVFRSNPTNNTVKVMPDGTITVEPK